MSERSELWTAFFIRWVGVSLLALFVTWLYNNNNPYWHIHVMWVVRFGWICFWTTQVIHIVFLLMIAWLVLFGKHEVAE